MLQLDPGALLRKLNRPVTQALEAAAGMALSRGHYEVGVEHLLSQLVGEVRGDINLILGHYGIDAGRLAAALTRQLESERSGNSGRPVLSPLLLNWLRDAWLLASVEQRQPAVRSGALLGALVAEPYSYTSASYVDLLSDIPRDELRREMVRIASGSHEEEAPAAAGSETKAGVTGTKPAVASGSHSRGPDTALGKFTQDFTAQARAGELDPVVGREAEIRQCIDILARRRKNNPIVVGEAGVGKTALVEGIAQRIVDQDVPELLKNVDLLGLDMGLLQAGASVKGSLKTDSVG